MTEKKKKGSKLYRTQTVTVRLDPKLRYLAEIAARKQRRTLSSFIEWAVEESLKNVKLHEGESGNYNDPSISVAEEAEKLWDVTEAEQFARLAIYYPELLTHEQQLIWKEVQKSRLLSQAKDPLSGEWDRHNLENLVFPEIREHWEDFQAIANGEERKLPEWNKLNPPLPPPSPPKMDDLEDEIIF